MTAVLFGWLVQAEHSFILLLSLGEVAACWEEATRQLWVSVMPKWANASVAGRWVEGSLHSGLVTSCPHPLVLIQVPWWASYLVGCAPYYTALHLTCVCLQESLPVQTL